jgi:hypothetical protein
LQDSLQDFSVVEAQTVSAHAQARVHTSSALVSGSIAIYQVSTARTFGGPE